jgi:hypothetical protein
LEKREQKTKKSRNTKINKREIKRGKFYSMADAVKFVFSSENFMSRHPVAGILQYQEGTYQIKRFCAFSGQKGRTD